MRPWTFSLILAVACDPDSSHQGPDSDPPPGGDDSDEEAVDERWVNGVGGVTTGEQDWLVLLVNPTGEAPKLMTDEVELVFEDVATWVEEASAGHASMNVEVWGWFGVPVSSLEDDLQVLYEAALEDESPLSFFGARQFVVFEAEEPSSGGSTTGVGPLGLILEGDGAFGVATSRAHIEGLRDDPATLTNIIHQLGHSMGLPDTHHVSAATGRTVEKGTVADPMGRPDASYLLNARQRMLLGWLPEEQAPTVDTSGTYTLHPIQESDGTRALRIPVEGAADTWLVVEYRGNDSGAPMKERGLLMTLDEPEPGKWPYLRRLSTLDATPDTPDALADLTLPPARTFSRGDIQVTLVEAGPDTAEVAVEMGPPSNTPPLIEQVTATPVEGNLYSFAVDASQPSGEPLHVAWRFHLDEDGAYTPSGMASGVVVEHELQSTEPQRVFVKVSDGRGASSWGWVDLFGHVPEAPQVVEVQANGSIELGHAFSADVQAEGPLEWHWDFGDGHTSVLPRPHHTYADPGTYTVTLTASDPEQSTVHDFVLDIPSPSKPSSVAEPGGSYAAYTQEIIVLDGSASLASDGDPAELSYRWKGPDGVHVHHADAPVAWMIAPGEPGGYTASLTVSDGVSSHTADAHLTVTIPPCHIEEDDGVTGGR